MNAVEILTKGKQILMEGRWEKAQGGVSPPWEGHCALTAVVDAGYKLGGSLGSVETRATNYLGRAAMDRGYMGVHLFNDAPETTFNDVISLFDEAIIRAKEDENV